MKPEMTPRQRMLTAFAFQEPDRVPITDLIFNASVYEAVLGHRPGYYSSEDAFKCSAALGMDAAFVFWTDYPAIEPTGSAGGRWESEWGCTYQTDEAAWGVGIPIDYRVKTRQDLEHFRPPDPCEPARMDPIKRAAELRAKNDLALIGPVRGPFANAAYHFIGMVNTMLAIYDDPDFLSMAFRMTIDFDIEVCRQMAECGVDIIWLTEDIAGTHGPLLSPAHYRELALPYLRELVDYIHSLGKPVVFHSDGNIAPFLEDLVEAGISGLNPLERTSGMDLADMKQRFGDRICLIGNVDNKRTLAERTPEQVEQEVKNCIRAAGPGGGYILMSDNSWHAGVSVENAHAMVKAGRKWGKYPLKWIEREV